MALFYDNLIQFDAVHYEFNPEFIVPFLNVFFFYSDDLILSGRLLKDFVFRFQL